MGDYRLDFCDVTVVEKPGQILFFNFHEKNVHYFGHIDWSNNERPDMSNCQPVFSWTRSCNKKAATKNNRFVVFKDTVSKDIMKRNYCLAMTSVIGAHGYDFKMIYAPIYECELFHDSAFDPDLYLRAQHSEQYLHSWPQSICYKDMYSKLFKSKEMAGFCVIKGGIDFFNTFSVTDNIFGFCVSKDYPDSKEIGEYSRTQIESYGKSVEKYCKRIEITAPRLNFKKSNLEVVSVQYLRWLIENRNL